MGLFSKRGGDANKDGAAPTAADARREREAVSAPPAAAAPQASAAPQVPAAPKTPASPSATPPSAQQSAAPARKQAASNSVGETDPARSFAALVSVVLTAPQWRTMPLEQARSILEPAVATGQFIVAASRAPDTGAAGTSAAVIWAMVSKDVDARLRATLDKPLELKPAEWRCGPHAWLIAALGDADAARRLIDVVRRGPLKGADLHARVTKPDGAQGLVVFRDAGAAA